MALAKAIFWGCLFLVAYTYLLYAIFLFLACVLSQVLRDLKYLISRRSRRAALEGPEQLPAVTLLVPAYNEEDCLLKKIANIRELDYPAEKLEAVIVSDGSTDRTNEILRSVNDPRIQPLFLTERQGKANALNQAAEHARHDILVFSDTSTIFAPDAIKRLVRHFSDAKVGVACGSQLLLGNQESQQTEGVYWKYEGILRLMEARLGATLTADGAIFALRHNCYRPLRPGDILDDFLIPMNARRLGYRVVYDPEAVAYEVPAGTIKGQFTRRVRIAIGSFRALGEVLRIPLPALTFWAFLSHKLLRWLVPFLLIGLLASNAFLLGEPLYRMLFAGQLLFYLWAGLGFAFRPLMTRVRFGLVGYFLVAMNVAFLVGFFRFLRGRGEATWQRVS